MYIINITVNADITAEQQDILFPRHVSWFTKFFDAGHFLILGPYTGHERAGIIIARTESRAELDTILQEDPYYPAHAQYEIREFSPKMIAKDLHHFLAG